MPGLTVLIVSYRCPEDLQQCLASVRREAERVSSDSPIADGIQTIVVDNGSDDGTVETVRDSYPTVDVVELAENRGFSGGVNAGIPHVRAPLVMLLNPDAIVLPGALCAIARPLKTCSSIGIAGPRVLNVDGTLQRPCRRSFPTVMNTFGAFAGLSRVVNEPYELPPPKGWRNVPDWADLTSPPPREQAELEDVDAVSGCAMAFRRDLIDTVGGFDESFHIFGEDLDFCYRAKQAGYRVVSVPGSLVVHKRGLSRQARPIASIVDGHRAMEIYYRKHLSERYNWLVNTVIIGAIRLRLSFLRLLSRMRTDHA